MVVFCVECSSKESVDTSSIDFFGTERLNWFVNRAHLSKNYKQDRKLIHSFFFYKTKVLSLS